MKSMRYGRSSILLPITLLCALPQLAWAGDCTSWPVTDPKKTHELKTSEILDCINKGVKPPKEWMPNPAVRGRAGAMGGGSGGFSIGTIAAPDMPPKAAGAQPSISALVSAFANAMKASQSNGKSTTSSAACFTTPGSTTVPGLPSACPVRDAVQNYLPPCGDFGSVTSFSAIQSIGLSCGGTVPLTNYRLTLVNNPIGFVRTDHRQYHAWIYKEATNKYALVGSKAEPLPEFLCEWYTDTSGVKRKRPSSTPPYSLAPLGQMITYNTSTKAIALRVLPPRPYDTSNPFKAADKTEKYLVLPITSGTVYVPRDDTPANDYKDCDIQDDFLKPFSALTGSSLSGDMLIEASQMPGCEADVDVCKKMGKSLSPSPSTSCETTTLYTSGNPAGTVCDGKMQYLVLDRPNLYFPPGSSVGVMPIEGVTSFMVSTNSAYKFPARIVSHSDTVLRLNQSPSSFVLTNGGVLGLPGNHRLVMRGPATLDMNSLQITLTNGGEEDNSGGTPIHDYGPGTVLPISPTALPITVMTERDILMPGNYKIPSQPAVESAVDPSKLVAPFVREPLTPFEE